MNKIKDLQEQLENLIKQGQELLEKMKENHIADASKTKRWKPKNDEKYFYITPDFKLNAEYFEGQFDEECWSAGNCFKTKEEAQKELDRRLAEQELLDLCDWNGEEQVRVIIYDVKTKKFDWNWFYEITSPYRFASKESVEKAIDTLGEEKLKLIFRID